MGGVETVIENLLRQFRQKGVKAHLVVWRWPEFLPRHGSHDELRYARLSFPLFTGYRIRRSSPRQLANLVALAARVVCARAHVVHVHGTDVHAAYAATVARLLRRPLVVTLHGEITGHSGDAKVVTRDPVHVAAVLRHASLVTAPAAAALQAAEALIGPLRNRTLVVPNGVALDEWLAAPSPIAPDGPTIVAVGRYQREKGFDVLIEAAALLRASSVRCRVHLIGSGDSQWLEDQIAASLLTDYVRLLDGTDRRSVVDAIRSATVVAIPSRTEAQPVVLLEAMAAARPICATRVGGIPDVLKDGSSGILVPPNDAAALADALARLLDDQTLRAQLGAAAHTDAAAYDWDRVATAWLEIYKDLLADCTVGRQTI